MGCPRGFPYAHARPKQPPAALHTSHVQPAQRRVVPELQQCQQRHQLPHVGTVYCPPRCGLLLQLLQLRLLCLSYPVLRLLLCLLRWGWQRACGLGGRRRGRCSSARRSVPRGNILLQLLPHARDGGGHLAPAYVALLQVRQLAADAAVVRQPA